MPISELKSKNVPVKLWAPLHEVESGALDQLKNTASLPWAFHHVAAMPDVHLGAGATVGSVVALKGAVSPAAVGVDIGCGMAAVRTSLRASDLPDSLEDLRSAIEAAIPVGFNSRDEGDLNVVGGRLCSDISDLFHEFKDLDAGVQDNRGRALKQLGTLGGGNHFVEVCLESTFPKGSDDPRVWLMLHSGSRNIGKTLAEIHIEVARELAHNEALPDRDLAVFLAGTPEMAAYRRDLFWAQRYAMLNRRVMMEFLRKVVRKHLTPPGGPPIVFDDAVMCHHNYVSEETHFGEDVIVTRKGAISARAGEMGIIPGSMGTKSYIVRGLGNSESFHSASHGAGRRMSRGAAKRQFTVEDLAAQTAGVCCRKDPGVLDEIPNAYKDIDRVMEQQADLVEIVYEIKQVLVVKG